VTPATQEIYDYYDLTFERGGWQRLRATFHREIAGALAPERIAPYALFLGMIGFHNDEAVAMTVRSGSQPRTFVWDDRGPVGRKLAVREVRVTTLAPTVRPLDSTPPAEDGVYAHRWFWIEPGDWDEFLALSEDGIWPFLESDGCRIVGLWEAAQTEAAPLRELLLITRYPSVAHWERTRMQSADPPPGADAALYARALAAGRKRAPLTQRTIVRLCLLVPPP